MVYIPFASLLGLQAALDSLFEPKQPVQGLASITAADFINPTLGGGSLLDHDSRSGLGEPLNVIISGLSSEWVLSDGGFLHYAYALGFGARLGNPQKANLGDGRGWVNQTIELRNDYGNNIIGTCWESLVGDNHLRMWRQSTTNALFLAVSEEENVHEGHTIKPNGYNLGRDSLVKSATGLKNYRGVKYQTTVQRITGLIAPGSTGINHGIATDGVVALLTVAVVK